MTTETVMLDEKELRRRIDDPNPWVGVGLSRGECRWLLDRLSTLEAEKEAAEKALRTVQNAAKTLAAAQGTELEHLRQNRTYDHRLRAEHESLLERDALMTETVARLEAEKKAAVEALEFYADFDHWQHKPRSDGEYTCRVRRGNLDIEAPPKHAIARAIEDAGAFARKVLKCARTLTESTNVPEASHDH